jgi:hypothetical protein
MLFVKVFFPVLILLIVHANFLLQLRKEERQLWGKYSVSKQMIYPIKITYKIRTLEIGYAYIPLVCFCFWGQTNGGSAVC